MNAFEEFMFDEKYVLRFYRVDHGLVCTINESMVSELREVESRLRQQQTKIEALKKQVDRKDNSIMALDMMIAQFEDKFGDYEKVINGVYSKVKPHEFIEAVKGKENIVGTPIMYAEWPIRNDK